MGFGVEAAVHACRVYYFNHLTPEKAILKVGFVNTFIVLYYHRDFVSSLQLEFNVFYLPVLGYMPHLSPPLVFT